jgi:tRNA-intron endonuclease
LGQAKHDADTLRKKELKINSFVESSGVAVSSSEGIEALSSRGYGVPENKKLILTFYEGLFLLSKGIVEVEDKEKRSLIGFYDLLQRFQLIDNNAWVKYLIYRDLRSRGYVVREGFGLGIDFRAYERGSYGKETAKYIVFGIKEGKPVSMREMNQALKYVQSIKKKLVLAVINRRGEVVYYSLSQMTLSEDFVDIQTLDFG